MATSLSAGQLATGSKVLRAMVSAGIPPTILEWAFPQAAMESGGFTSPISRDDNNFSGILFTGRGNQKNATRSTKHRLTDSGMAVAHFATIEDWAVDFKRVISLGTYKPISATTREVYFTRLKANNYFGAQSAASYMAQCMAWEKKLAAHAGPLKAASGGFLSFITNNLKTLGAATVAVIAASAAALSRK